MMQYYSKLKAEKELKEKHKKQAQAKKELEAQQNLPIVKVV